MPLTSIALSAHSPAPTCTGTVLPSRSRPAAGPPHEAEAVLARQMHQDRVVEAQHAPLGEEGDVVAVSDFEAE